MKRTLLTALLALIVAAPSFGAITEDDIIAVSGADISATTLNLTATDTTGSEGAILFACHEGAPTTYTWTSLSGGSGGTFASLGTVNGTVGGGAGDLSINVTFVRGFTPGASHIFRVTFGATRPFRYGGGIVLSGSFDASHVAATTQTAEGIDGSSIPPDSVDAGSLVTDAAAYLLQTSCNYSGATMTNGAGWTTKSNAVGGRHFQARNEASSGTFDPIHTLSGSGNPFVTVAAAIKEAAGGGGSTVPVKMNYYRQMRRR